MIHFAPEVGVACADGYRFPEGIRWPEVGTIGRKKSTSKHESDPALVRACLKGEERAWHTLVERYGRLVFSVARRYGFDEADAEDVHQSVFLILFRRLETLEDQTRLSAWLITTTHRECWRRGRRKAETVELDERDIRADEPPEALTEQWELQHAVRDSLRELGGPCEALLEALFLRPAEQDYESIAAELDMKVGSIGPTRARCFRKLEAILRARGVTLEPAEEAI